MAVTRVHQHDVPSHIVLLALQLDGYSGDGWPLLRYVFLSRPLHGKQAPAQQDWTSILQRLCLEAEQLA